MGRDGGYMTETETSEEMFAEQSWLYLSVAHAYRNTYLSGASGGDCFSEAVKAVRNAHPFLSDKEASRFADRVISKFSELYPDWLSK
jgi:hypothetical protein